MPSPHAIMPGFVVLNYGPPEMAFRACLSIIEQVPLACVVLVDNLSTEENRAICQQTMSELQSPNCQLLAMPDNRGYAAGMNAGLNAIFGKEEVSLAFVVNSDVVLRKFKVPICPGDMEALVAPTLITNGRRHSGLTQFIPLLCLRRPGARQDAYRDRCVYVEGCFLGMTRAFFRRTNGFCEDYFLYFEELDLVCRYRQMRGIFPEIVHAPEVVVEHLHGGVTGMRPGKDRSKLAEYWSARSRMLFFLRWYPRHLCVALLYNTALVLRDLSWARIDLAIAVWRGTRDALWERFKPTKGQRLQ